MSENTQTNNTTLASQDTDPKVQTELTARGRAKDMKNATLVFLPSVSQCRRVEYIDRLLPADLKRKLK